MFYMLLCGLGNIGGKYENTLHNAGFMAVDIILDYFGIAPIFKTKFHGLYLSATIHSTQIMFVKPQTYMNDSGISIYQFKNFFRIENSEIFIIHDDIDLQMGKIKFKTGGGNGGHNGLKSIDKHIGNSYHRMRFGVGRPQNSNFDVSDYVLSRFIDSDLRNFEEKIKIVCKNIIFLLEKKFSMLSQLMI